jgi:hypothetical protein
MGAAVAEQRAEYVAVKRIELNGVGAYNPGDPVDARVVVGSPGAGEGAWISLDDVQATGAIPLARPAGNASQAAWAAFAVSRGVDAELAADMSRADLIEATEDV